VPITSEDETLTVTLNDAGTYKFRATVSCPACTPESAFSDVVVTVVDNLLTDVSITASSESIDLQSTTVTTLTASVTPSATEVEKWEWVESSGNPEYVLTQTQKSSDSIIVSFKEPGIYQFEVFATSSGITVSGGISITVSGNSITESVNLPSFPTSDSLYNVKYFVFDQNDTGLFEPSDIDLSDVLNLPLHTYQYGNKSVTAPCAYPSVCTAKNNLLMINNEQYIFVVYQAFVLGKWQIYLRQIRISKLDQENPRYLPPYDFADGSSPSFHYLSESPQTIVYIPVAFYTINLGDEIITRVIYEMEIEDGRLVLERDFSGNDPTYLNRARVLISYSGDLSSYWINNKNTFAFTSELPNLHGDNIVPPFDLISSMIYGVHPVQRLGQFSKWVFFAQAGDLVFDDPNGYGSGGTSVTHPVLVAKSSGHCTRPKTFLNANNELMVAYEDTASGIPQIKITGTGDFCGDSLYGPTGSYLTKFFQSSDFKFSHTVTREGINQVPDIFVDDSNITHMCWQSSKDADWEIYYANSKDYFNPVRITKSKGRSTNPKLAVNSLGIYITYHDNRFGEYEILVSKKLQNQPTPLLQQEGYLASLRNGYSHYINTLEFIVKNTRNYDTNIGIKLEFYDNRVFFGSRTEIVSTALNPDNFQLTDDSFVVDFATGVFVAPGHARKVLFVVGNSSFNFSPNQTYFVKISFVFHDGTEEVSIQPISFSCTTCNIPVESRWTSSASGYSDIRITDSAGNSVRPTITSLKNDTILILWEDFRFSNESQVLGALIDDRNDILKSSGSQNWFDYNYNISGLQPNVTNDLFGRTITTYSKTGTSAGQLPVTTVSYKLCDFIQEATAPNQNSKICAVPFSDTQNTEDSQIYNLARIKRADINYFTINNDSSFTPVVSKRNINITLIGSPDLVAYRVKNENDTVYGEWINFSPEINNYTTEFKWVLSPNSGSKTVCIQTITYAGKTTPISINVIADFVKQEYSIEITKEDDSLFPEYNGRFVVSPLTSDSIKVKVKIFTQNELTQPPVFDVVHQGFANLANITTELVDSSDSFVYVGYFTLYKEDGKLFKDGVAQIVLRFFDTTEVKKSAIQKDNFNVFSDITQTNSTDDLEAYRNQTSNLIGIQPDSRYLLEDPYFAFGDPYYIKKENLQ